MASRLNAVVDYFTQKEFNHIYEILRNPKRREILYNASDAMLLNIRNSIKEEKGYLDEHDFDRLDDVRDDLAHELLNNETLGTIFKSKIYILHAGYDFFCQELFGVKYSLANLGFDDDAYYNKIDDTFKKYSHVHAVSEFVLKEFERVFAQYVDFKKIPVVEHNEFAKSIFPEPDNFVSYRQDLVDSESELFLHQMKLSLVENENNKHMNVSNTLFGNSVTELDVLFRRLEEEKLRDDLERLYYS